jgi:hypothetical protein
MERSARPQDAAKLQLLATIPQTAPMLSLSPTPLSPSIVHLSTQTHSSWLSTIELRMIKSKRMSKESIHILIDLGNRRATALIVRLFQLVRCLWTGGRLRACLMPFSMGWKGYTLLRARTFCWEMMGWMVVETETGRGGLKKLEAWLA